MHRTLELPASGGIVFVDVMEQKPAKAPDCLKCTHFSVSWDPEFPRKCAVFGIKSVRMPSEEVFLATGRHCPAFRKSEKLKEKE